MSTKERGPYAKSVEVKRGILEACIAAFGSGGFHGASMAEIARRAGISHTGLLYHFPQKEALLTAVLEMQDQRAAAYLEKNDQARPILRFAYVAWLVRCRIVKSNEASSSWRRC